MCLFREWWGKGFVWEKWDVRSDDFDWEPCRITCAGDWFEQSPIIDEWCLPERLLTVHFDEVRVTSDGREYDLPIEKWFPAIRHYKEPYVELFKEQRMNDGIPSFAFALDVFFDGFHVTVGSTGQILQPLGGYMSIINLYGNKEIIFEWGMIPKHMNYYSFGSFLEKKLLEMTFEGWQSTFWNPWKNEWMDGIFYALPMKFTGDLPEVKWWTQITTSNATKECRYITQFFDAINKLGFHGSWDDNSWLKTDILMGNVPYFFNCLFLFFGYLKMILSMCI